MATVAVKPDCLAVGDRYRLSLHGGLGITGKVTGIRRGLVVFQLDHGEHWGMWLSFPQSWIYKAWRLW